MDQRTWKLMTLHTRDYVDRLHMSKKEGQGRTTIEYSIDNPYNDLKTT